MSNIVNTSGVTPAGFRVLIKPEESFKSKGGMIVIPDNVKERNQLTQTFGTVIEVGKTAYHYDKLGGEAWCKPGDRIMFGKYVGMVVKGIDGEQYRIINDEDVVAVVAEAITLEE